MEHAESHVMCARQQRNCKAKHKLPHRDETYLASHFSGCGHMTWMTMVEPLKETSRTSMHNNMEWLRNLMKEVCSQCHGRRFRVWTWEQAAAQCVGAERTKVALNMFLEQICDE